MTQNKVINDAIDRLKQKQLISKETAEALKVKNPEPPNFHILPKIHKINNPGRRAVNCIGCHNTNISKFADYHLQPIVKTVSTYVQDSNDFQIPVNRLLVTMDVKQLYTNTPNLEKNFAVETAYESCPETSATAKVIIAFLALFLTLNCFMFNCKDHLQMRGSAMGATCTPIYTIIFMARFEEKLVYSFIKDKVELYLRCIDDIFMMYMMIY